MLKKVFYIVYIIKGVKDIGKAIALLVMSIMN